MSLGQIVAALEARGIGDVASVAPRVYREWQHVSLAGMETLFRQGGVGQVEYEAYCYLWRNMAPRFGVECDAYSLEVKP